MRVLRRGLQPVIVFGRHHHEFTPVMASDLDRLALSLMHVLAELVLEFEGGGSSHGCSDSPI